MTAWLHCSTASSSAILQLNDVWYRLSLAQWFAVFGGAVAQPVDWAVVREETGRGKDRFKISELFADERCSKAILDFLAITEVGRTAGPPVADEEPGSEGEERTRGIPCTGGGGRGVGRGGGRLGCGGVYYRFSLSFLFHMSSTEGGGGGHTVEGALGGSAVAGT